ncbi:WD domain-containing protein [Drepanopeziza brunnea f. sp. 'multigermtubi' MB_m1]|uniref:WD domain-containing protein n=1 Tax=Marssonina brunnea f. sp. multigermtubi (strain MB_m1) TaxID=1072389 RepID=K1WPB9_MARBU|nr:WD domain-containing protein [Drepanopeziza brunnea f. sp. 'multigermtubi' MB_m1]EKD14816.1 WD domain-containing protein [Drepanopeziza brunnea f. sp. 'multigermtubi' MB_m1]
MDPPIRPVAKRRAVSAQQPITAPSHFISEGSPSPFASNPKYLQGVAKSQSPPALRSRNRTVSVGWVEGGEAVSRRTSSLQVELAECVETKTVTTTTTTKRSYPPLLVRQRSLGQLNAKEYPLAMKPPPAELLNFSYEIGGDSYLGEDDIAIEDLLAPSRTPSCMSDQSKIQASRGLKATPTEKGETQRADRLSQKLAMVNQRRSTSRLQETQPDSPTSMTERPHKSKRNIVKQGQDHNSIRVARRRPHQGLGVHLMDEPLLPATPDMSDLDIATDRAQPYTAPFFEESTYTPHSATTLNDSFEDVESPVDAVSQDFANAVATPPTAESDLELVSGSSTTSAQQRPTLNTAAAQNASLPSPGLSPTFASATLNPNQSSGAITAGDELLGSPATQDDDSQQAIDDETLAYESQAMSLCRSEEPSLIRDTHSPSVMDAQSMLLSFDAMPVKMQTLMMYQLLRRCSRKTLHVVAHVVNPALKCDFLDQLPLELSLHVLSFMNHRDLCRASQVSKRWRDIVDTNETGWKELFDHDGFVMPAGELDKAIQQGWGWQDPVGPDGCEQDLSPDRVASSSGADNATSSISKPDPIPVRKGRSVTKRKRVGVGSNTDRSKRRAVGHEFADKANGMLARYPHTARFHKSQGPITAANAAVLAVPDPKLSLPTLRKLHLFKSLYRRHYMLQHAWTDGKVAPHHFAFPAHPANVITCLQFDDDKILTGSDDNMIHVYDTKTGVLRKKLTGHDGGVWALQYEGNVLVSGSTDRSVRVWDIEKGLCTQVFHGHTSTVRCLQILMPELVGKAVDGKPIMVPSQPLIITGSRDSQLRVWKLPEAGSKRYIQNGPPANDTDCPYFVRTLTGHSHSVRAIAAHQDTLVSGSYDNSVRVWKISTGETIHVLRGHAMKVYSVVLDHKRNRCISGSMDNFVKIWSLETGVCLYTLEGHSSLVGLLDLRDERLVSAAADSTLRIWDPENGKCKSTLSAHTGAITCFQHDGQKVISGSDRTLKLWDIKTGECIKDILTDLSGVWQVKFDQRRCVAAVQRDNLTYVEVLDFGASRDGIPASQRGSRRLLPDTEDRIIIEDDDA